MYFNKIIDNKIALIEKCWKGYKMRGYKKKGNRKVPNCIKEELSDREIRLQALKELPTKRTFEVFYQPYERHGDAPSEEFIVSGLTLFDALEELPGGVFNDIFGNLSDEELYNMSENEEDVKDYLDNVDPGGWPFLGVYENGVFLCGFPRNENEDV
jgi:hypothetical protein